MGEVSLPQDSVQKAVYRSLLADKYKVLNGSILTTV
ncbi:MAG: hypothetical protein ACI9LM_003387 [Alteromonadaceae bacterium]|jgi:hypothetical protein